jgi:hypothetical protein
MKKLALAVMMMAVSSNILAADFRIRLTRDSGNLYKADNLGDGYSNVWYIATSLCLEFAIYDDSIVSYVPYSFNNKITFHNGKTCKIDYIQNVINYR